MVTVNTILQKLSPYQGNKKLIVEDQTTGDIVTGILNTHKKYFYEYDKICEYFLGNTLEDTCNNIFNFLKKNVPYYIEPGTKQSLRSPAAILQHLKGADCKSYALFSNGVLSAIARNYYNDFSTCFRFAGYNTRPGIEHVFCVVKTQGKEIWIDPVLNYFDSREKTPNFIKDKTPKVMLYSVNGIPQSSINKLMKYQQRNNPPYVFAGKRYESVGGVDDVVNMLPIPAPVASVLNSILSIFGGKSDGENRKAEFDKQGISVDDIAKYYILNRNNFGQKNDWQLNEFSELYSNKAPSQGHNWTDRTNEIKLSTAKAFNAIVSQYLNRYDNAEWRKILLDESKTIKDTTPGGGTPGTPNKPSLAPIAIGILALKILSSL